MTTIGNLNYKIAVDTQGFTKGIVATKSELRDAAKLMDSTKTPAERMAAGMSRLENLLSKGAISQETFNRAVAQLETARFEELRAEVQASMDGLQEAAGQLAVFGAAATAAFGAAAYAALDSAAQYEQTTIAFTTLMGNADAARQTLADLTQFAATTPFQMPQLEQVARGLLGFGLSGAPMLQFMRRLGDAAAATNSDLSQLGQIFVKIRGSGQLMGDTFAQLSERGVLFHKDIAEHFGIAESEVKGFVSAGKVGFADVEAILARLTAEGGRYHNAMLAQSQSAAGLSSTLSDNLAIALRGIGEDLLPVQKAFTDMAISAVAGFAELDPALRGIVSGTIGLGAALGGTATALTAGVFGATKLYTAYATMTATLTTLSQATAGATAATGAQTAASYAATIALKGLTIAKYAAAGAAGALAAATALYVGYNVGQTLHGWTAAGQTAARVMDGLRSSMEAITTLDFAGTAREDLEQYIASTERSIAKMQQHNAELQAGQAWWNFWQRNADGIEQNEAQIKTLQDALARARTELHTGQTSPAVQNQEAVEAVDKYTAKMHEQIATAGMAADAVELWRLRQEGATQTQLDGVAAMQRQAAQATAMAALKNDTDSLVDSLQTQIDAIGRSEAEVVRLRLAARGLRPEWLATIEAMQQRLAVAQDTEATRQKVEQLTSALQAQIATAGMSAEEIQRWQLAQQGATAEQLAHIAALQSEAAAIKEAAEARKDAENLMAEGERLAESLRTPAERVEADIERARGLYARGAIDADTYARAILKAREQLTAAEGPVEMQVDIEGVDAAVAGSQAAVQAIARHRQQLAGIFTTAMPADVATATPRVTSDASPMDDRPRPAGEAIRDVGSDRQTVLLAKIADLLAAIEGKSSEPIQVREVHLS